MAKSPSNAPASIEVVDDSEEERSKKDTKKDVSNADTSKASEGDEEGDEEEYEIEAILDAKHGAFPMGRTGYLVKWKGYSSEHNSWVDQKDAAGAEEMIEEYWQKKQKSNKSKSRGARPRPRKSGAKAASPEADEPTSTNKRKKSASGGRNSRSFPPGEDQPMEEDDEEEKQTTKKVKMTSKEESGEMDVDTHEPDDGGEYLPMDKTKYREKSWEKLVKRVDTIEKTENNLRVFFTLNNGDKVVGNSRECAKYFPQKLIQFYESNLRWRESE